MPPSIQFIQDVGTATQFQKAVSAAPNLAELLELVPAPYRQPMQDLVNRVYRAAIKANHTRSYLAGLEKHEQDNTFPPEIGARVNKPALQISKEYSSAADCREKQQAMDTAVVAHKKLMLSAAIELKKAEMAHLQGLFAEKSYADEAKEILQNITAALVTDGGGQVLNQDGSSAEATWPSWIKEDYLRMKTNYTLFPARAVALAFSQVSREMSSKMRGLSLKKQAEDDIEMEEGASRSDNVDAIVERKFSALLKKHNLQNEMEGRGRKPNLLSLVAPPKPPSHPTRSRSRARKAKDRKAHKERKEEERDRQGSESSGSGGAPFGVVAFD